MNKFLETIINRDPAAKSKLSIILTYPGVKAVFFHRIANFFAVAKFDLIARIISQFSRFLTEFLSRFSADLLGPTKVTEMHKGSTALESRWTSH